MNSISVWKDKLILNWDGAVPATAPANSVKCPDDVVYFWPHLLGHARWSKSMAAFTLDFSKQNIIRLHKQFGQIPVKSGKDRIDELHAKNDATVKMVHMSMKCKELPIERLPTYDYKMKPLGEYQHRGVILLSNVKKFPLFADCGCLSGDTIIRYNIGGAAKSKTIAELFRYFHSQRSNRTLQPSVRSFNGERIQLHSIKNVVESGIKDVYEIILMDGKKLKATADHLILTRNGWIQTARLTKSDEVMIDNLTKHQKKGKKESRIRKGDRRLAVGKFHPYARKQLCHHGRSHSYLVEEHRVVYEAHINGLSIDEFILATRTDTTGMRFVDTSVFDIHHKNHDHYDNRPDNLEAISKADHHRIHTGYKDFGHGVPEYSSVVSVEFVGPEMTYDICCYDPHHNFVANGIVVHNSGKTFMVLTSTERQIKLNLVKPGKTLICVKLSTIETGWLEDAKKFTNLKLESLWVPTSNKKRKEIVAARLNTDADAFVINHEGLKVFEKELIAKDFEKVVVDESTILKSYHGMHAAISGGQLGRSLMRISHKAQWRVVMSGTPAPNGPQDLWGQFSFLDPDGLFLESSYRDFQNEYMEVVDLRGKDSKYLKNKATGEFLRHDDGKLILKPLRPGDPMKWVPKKDTNERVGSIINSLVYRLKIRDHIKDLPPLTMIKRLVHMDSEQARHYKDMEERLKIELEDVRITVPIKLAQMMKLRQVTGGFVIDNNEEAHALPKNPKMDELDSLLNDEIAREDKVVIYAEYQWEIRTLLERYKSHGIVAAYGGNKSTAVSLENIKRFIEDPSIRIIVLHPKSAAHGITLTCAHYMIFYSFSHSAEDAYQSAKRIERAGQKHPMFIYHIICGKSIDVDMYDVIQVKNDNQADLLDQDQLLINIWNQEKG